MDNALYLSMSAAREIMQAQTVHANNLANASTDGFKADLAQARALQVYGEGHAARVYSATESPATNFTQGGLEQTGRNLDVAVRGPGWFSVAAADGSVAYTRAGSFQVDALGMLRTDRGDFVLGDGGPISLPPFESILFGTDGSVTVQPTGQDPSNLLLVDRLRLVNPEPGVLTKSGDGLFRGPTEALQEADPDVRVVTGMVENSNVNVVNEMTEILALAREFEIQLQLMKTVEENDQAASELVSVG